MRWKYVPLLLYGCIIVSVSAFGILSIFRVIPPIDFSGFVTSKILQDSSAEVVSPQVQGIVITPSVSGLQEPVDVVVPLVVMPSAIPKPVYSISISRQPGEITQGEGATFSWYVNGNVHTIQTTTLYFGLHSFGGVLEKTISPTSTTYTDWLKEFMDGNYSIPLSFTATKYMSQPGTYYFRPYALIDGDHYWGDEGILVIKPMPKHEIRFIDRPTTVAPGKTITFTWEIIGPPATTGFTVIAGGKQSKPEPLDASYALTMTPYSVLVEDFTKGTYSVPLRFIGNARAQESGVYYYRALAFINNTNIWSEEYSYTVQ